MCRYLSWFLILFRLSIVNLESIHKRHEYQFSFKSPIITTQNNEIPFFDVGGHVIVNKDRIRLTTSLPNQQGWIWSKNTSSFDGFETHVVFKISGNGRIGSDGLALWMVQSKTHGGPALGASSKWNGLGILFDTYDNHGRGINPGVVGIMNDNTKEYRSDTDGRDISIGHCNHVLRNLPYSMHCRVTYSNKLLIVAISTGLSKPDTNDMDECFRAKVDIPKADYYFGLSSSTGLMADDHDVEKLEVFSFTELAQMRVEDEIKHTEERKRYEEEYQHRMDTISKTETAEERAGEDIGDTGISKNLMAIWHEIADQHKTMRGLIKSVGVINDGMATSEKGSPLTELESMRGEILIIMNEVEQVSRKMENKNNTHESGKAFIQIYDKINELKRDIDNVVEKMNNINEAVIHINEIGTHKPINGSCEGCLSIHTIVVLGSLQSAMIIGFIIYQKSGESSVNKFY